MSVYFGGLFSYCGTQAEREAEFESVQKEVNDILQTACSERRLRLTGEAYLS